MILRRPSSEALAEWTMALAVVCAAGGWWWPAPTPLSQDGHLLLSLNAAINLTYCGSTSLASEAPLSGYLFQHRELQHRPIPDVIAQRSGSVGGYCATLTTPHLNNENSLMWLMRAGLEAHPSASVAWLGRWLLWFKVGGLMLFAVAALSLGSGPLFAALSFAAGLAVLANLSEAGHHHTVYSLLLPVTLANAGFWALALARMRHRRTAWHVAVMVLGGLLVGFSAQVRTSYTPVFCFLAFAYCAAVWRLRDSHATAAVRSRGGRVVFVAGSCAGFVIGYLAFMRVFITPLVPPGTLVNYSHHIISHPLVLSLALPANNLARREGIKWDDATGLDLARRLNRSVAYFGPGYSEALTSYYFHLWRRHPRAMIRIYSRKSAMAGRAVMDGVRGLRHGVILLAAALLPISWVPDGHWLLAVLVAATVAGLGGGLSTRSPRRIAIGALAGVLVLLQIESSIIVPEFSLQLHSTYLGLAAILGIALYTPAVRGLVGAFRGAGAEHAAVRLPLAVFAAVFLTAFVGRHVPSGSSSFAVQSDLAIAIVGTIVFLTVRALGGRRSALVLFGLLLCALVLRTVATTTADTGVRLVGDQPPADPQAVTDLTGPPSVWTFQAPNVKQSEHRVVVDGPVQQRYSYLLISVPRRLEAGSYVVAEGDLREGGISVGLQQANNWVVYRTVVEAGRFRTSLLVPRDGNYQLVLANAVSTDTSRNVVEFSSVVVVR